MSMKPEDIITPEMINRAERLEACEGALHWLRVKPRTWGEMADRNPDYYLWAAGHGGPVERLDECAKECAWAALEYCAELLTPERLDWCAKADPCAALQYCADKLTPERKAWCLERV